MTGPVQIIFGAEWRKQHLTRGLEVGGGAEGGEERRNGVRAHLSAELNYTMATAECCVEMSDSQRVSHQGGPRSPSSGLPDTADLGSGSHRSNCFLEALADTATLAHLPRIARPI